MRQALSILAPFGWLYGRLGSIRREAYARGVFRQEALRSPVISVGGLAMGGSMKTPVVIELARTLAARGPSVGVIGHGYFGDDPGPRLVSDGKQLLETPGAVGDEAVLLAHELPGSPIAVGRDKAAAGRLLESRFGKAILLVDSGFQHLRLFRDVDIVCVGERDLEGRVVPAGLLRESVRALTAASMIFTDRETDGPAVARLRELRPDDVFSVARADFAFFSGDGSGVELEPPARAFVFCGIGWPARFVKDVIAQKVDVAGQRFFRDHHPFTEQELKDVQSAAETAGALAVVTTTKDAVRIHTWPGPLPLLVLAARLDIEKLPRVLKRIDRVILERMKAGK